MKLRHFLIPLFVAFEMTSCVSSQTKEGQGLSFKFEQKEEKKDVDPKVVIDHIYFDSAGDCTVIKVGGKKIVIDSGPSDILEFDKKLEKAGIGKKDTIDYVFMTHQDDDHTGNFNMLLMHDIVNYIDFDCTVDSTVKESDRNKFLSKYAPTIKTAYQKGVKYRVNNTLVGAKIENYYTASQCCYERRGVDKEEALKSVESVNRKGNKEVKKHIEDSPDVFTIPVGDNDFTIKVLYNQYNTKPFEGAGGSAIRNNMAVCLLMSYCNEKFLFTGDLMEFETESGMKRINGETNLVNNNIDDLKDGVAYFRGGHHGSKSSNSQYFASVIRPQYVFWNGDPQTKYYFPRSSSIINMGKYTDKIYYSSINAKYQEPNQGKDEIENAKADDKSLLLHGASTFTFDPTKKGEGRFKVDYENDKEPDSLFVSSLLRKADIRGVSGKDSIKQEYAIKEYPINIYNLTSTAALPSMPFDCTYVKIGHIDILIGAGWEKGESDPEIVKKIKYLCNDKVLDYVIVPSSKEMSYSCLIGEKGLFADKNYTIKNLIYRDVGDEGYSRFIKDISDRTNIINKTTINKVLSEAIVLPISNDSQLNKKMNMTLRFLSTPYAATNNGATDNYQYSIATLITVDNFSYLHLGVDHTYGYNDPNDLNNNYYLDNVNNKFIINNVDVLQMPRYGYMLTNEYVDAFYSFVGRITTNKENNNHAHNNNNGRSGLTVLCNSTMYYNGDIFKYPYNIYENNGNSYSYLTNGVEKKLLMFVTQKTKDDSKAIPYLSKTINGDIDLRATIQKGVKKASGKLKFYTKVTYGVNRNYATKVGDLFFCRSATGKFNVENEFGKVSTYLNKNSFVVEN